MTRDHRLDHRHRLLLPRPVTMASIHPAAAAMAPLLDEGSPAPGVQIRPAGCGAPDMARRRIGAGEQHSGAAGLHPARNAPNPARRGAKNR